MVTFSIEFFNIVYNVNSALIIICRIQSLTIPEVTWTSNTDVALRSSLSSNEDIHTSHILLQPVILKYSGKYTCSAENEGGEMSDTININVYGKNMSLSVC